MKMDAIEEDHVWSSSPGWSARLLFAVFEDRFSREEAQIMICSLFVALQEKVTSVFKIVVVFFYQYTSKELQAILQLVHATLLFT